MKILMNLKYERKYCRCYYTFPFLQMLLHEKIKVFLKQFS